MTATRLIGARQLLQNSEDSSSLRVRHIAEAFTAAADVNGPARVYTASPPSSA
jgi:hypothetical protein